MLTLPIEFLHERLSYDPATGELRWKSRPSDKCWSARLAGTIAGSEGDGCIKVALTYRGKKRLYKAHRIAFAMTKGYWPTVEIDHWNGVTSDNRFLNLREATHAENGQNVKKRIDNTSGHPGVNFMSRISRWRARVQVRGKTVHLGVFETRDEACLAYVRAKESVHPFYNGREA